MEKVYYIHKRRNGKHQIIKGTLEELINYFGYTLKVGNSYNPKINTHPTTIKSFVSNLQKSLYEQEAGCFNRTFVNIATENEIELYKKN